MVHRVGAILALSWFLKAHAKPWNIIGGEVMQIIGAGRWVKEMKKGK